MIARDRQTTTVDLGGGHSYDVVITADVEAALNGLDVPSAVVICDQRVEPLARRLAGALGAAVLGMRAVVGGEVIKAWPVVAELHDWLSALGAGRDTLLIAVGGGTVTDLVGFAAATFMRGVPWCAVPTTVLAAVDAAVGGKTGINITAGKNLVGAFHHPVRVIVDPSSFTSLDARDLAAGMAEAVKTAIVADAELFKALETSLPLALAGDPATLAFVVARCVRAKARIVASDELDENDGRAILNFGHTLGHALEKTAGYGTLRHGEAVACGMRVALALSHERGLAHSARLEKLVRALPTPPVARDADALLVAMQSDKKRKAGALRFVLVRDLEAPYLADDVSETSIRAALSAL